MNYQELYRELQVLLPRESWCVEVQTWRHFSKGAGPGNPDQQNVNVTWKVWLAEDGVGVEAPTAERTLVLVRDVVAARRPKPAPEPQRPESVEAIGEIGVVSSEEPVF